MCGAWATRRVRDNLGRTVPDSPNSPADPAASHRFHAAWDFWHALVAWCTRLGAGLHQTWRRSLQVRVVTITLVTSSLLSGPKHVLCNDPAVRIGKIFRLELAGNHLFDLVLQPQCNLGDLLGRMWWGEFIGSKSREHC